MSVWGDRVRTALRILLAAFFVYAGAMHFAKPDIYVRIMPPYLPYPLALVMISGVCEVLGGVGVLIPPLRRLAGLGLIALLIAVFPANVHMALSHDRIDGLHIASIWLWLRLPLQLVLIAWVWWCTRPSREKDSGYTA